MTKNLACTFLLFITATLCQAQLVSLALNLAKGETYYRTSTSNAAVTQTVNGQKNSTNTVISSRISFKVTGIRDTLYDMEVRYESLILKMKFPSGDLTYSSDNADFRDPSSAILAAFKNQPLTAVMTKSGNLVSISGISAIFDKMIAQYPGLDTDQKSQIRSTMEQSFGEQAFRSNYEMGAAIFPAIPVKKGVLWVSDSQLAGPAITEVHTIYELKDIADDFYHIRANSVINYPDRDVFKTTNGMPVKNNLNGIMTADIVVDKTTGWLKQSTIMQTINGITEIKDNPQLPGGLVMPVYMQSDITITDAH